MQAGNVVHRRGVPKGVHIPHAWQWLPHASPADSLPSLVHRIQQEEAETDPERGRGRLILRKQLVLFWGLASLNSAGQASGLQS